MKQIPKYILLVFIAAFVSACSTPALYSPGPPGLSSDDEGRLFQQSEKFLEGRDWDQALSGFSGYLSQYPQGRYADRALLRIGYVYTQKGEYDAAQAFYQRLVDNFPGSPYATEARLAIVDLLVPTRCKIA